MRPVFLVIDNYDSFTYNLVQLLGEIGAEVKVYRNDRITLDGIEEANPEAIVISPGPGTPSQAGICLDCVHRFAGRIPVFGVCLGYQCIAQAFGARIVPAERLMHGKSSPIEHDRSGIFTGISSPFEAGRYHSLIISPQSLPDSLEVTARTPEGEIMGLRHHRWPVQGVQFHPESVLTAAGKELLANVVDWARAFRAEQRLNKEMGEVRS